MIRSCRERVSKLFNKAYIVYGNRGSCASADFRVRMDRRSDEDVHRGRHLIGDSIYDSSRYASEGMYDTDYEVFDLKNAMSVYCSCGRIVNLDRDEMNVRIALGKELECSKCRNQRISIEIDALNEHFAPVAPE